MNPCSRVAISDDKMKILVYIPPTIDKCFVTLPQISVVKRALLGFFEISEIAVKLTLISIFSAIEPAFSKGALLVFIQDDEDLGLPCGYRDYKKRP